MARRLEVVEDREAAADANAGGDQHKRDGQISFAADVDELGSANAGCVAGPD